MIKTSGAEWKRFYTDPSVWKEGCWHEDETVDIDGLASDEDLAIVADEAKVTLIGGVFFPSADGNPDEMLSLELVFRSWRKRQTTVFLSVECSRDKEASIREAIEKAGGKVRKA
jgi:hypothetical protein